MDGEILSRLQTYPWFGTDPVRTRDVMELGKYLDPRKIRDPDDYVTVLLIAADRLEASRNG